jgi:hypothetical protein
VKGRKRDEVDLKASRKVHKFIMKLGIGRENCESGSKTWSLMSKYFWNF